jgi:putative endonuclease
MVRQCYVYILTNCPRGVLHTGVTNDLARRLWEHRSRQSAAFTKKYNLRRLVYFEVAEGPLGAIAREKEIKGWVRRKKIDLVEAENTEWRDLCEDWR